LKIIHIFPVVKFGGAPIVVLNLIKSDQENTHIVISRKDDEALSKEFEIHSDKFYDINTLDVSVISMWKIIKVFNFEKPDIIHAHGKGGALYALIPSLALFKPAKIIYTFHGFNNRFNGLKSLTYLSFEKLLAFFVDRYVAVSNTEKTKVLNTGIFDENKVNVIENGISIEKKEFNKEGRILLSNYSYNIVTLSRISCQKDLETMLLAFNELLKISDNKNIGLHIIGGYIKSDEIYVHKVFALCKDLELEKNVIFWNDLAFASSYLHHFNLYWSTALWEGLPTAVIESMMQKILVVGTDVVGNIDLIKTDTGVITPIEDYKKIADILHTTINSNNENLIDTAYKFINKNFSVGRYKDKILSLYHEVSQ